ncbi:hypothetical protein ACFL0W_01890 [Nanoarchaeota archaeon]
MKCRKEDYCKYGAVIVDEETGEKDSTDKDSKRCFRCVATNYSMFEPVTDDDEEE